MRHGEKPDRFARAARRVIRGNGRRCHVTRVARSAKLEAVIAVHADGVGADSQIEESDRLDCEIISGLGAVRQRAGNTGKNRVAGDIAGVGAGGLEIDDSRYIEQSIGGGAEVGDVGAPSPSEDFLGCFIVTDASGCGLIHF